MGEIVCAGDICLVATEQIHDVVRSECCITYHMTTTPQYADTGLLTLALSFMSDARRVAAMNANLKEFWFVPT